MPECNSTMLLSTLCSPTDIFFIAGLHFEGAIDLRSGTSSSFLPTRFVEHLVPSAFHLPTSGAALPNQCGPSFSLSFAQ